MFFCLPVFSLSEILIGVFLYSLLPKTFLPDILSSCIAYIVLSCHLDLCLPVFLFMSSCDIVLLSSYLLALYIRIYLCLPVPGRAESHRYPEDQLGQDGATEPEGGRPGSLS